MTPQIGGFYRHFTGGIYIVLAIARDYNNPDTKLVVYCEFGGDESESWARSLEEWRNPTMVNGQPVVRFTEVPDFICRECRSTLPIIAESEYFHDICFLCK